MSQASSGLPDDPAEIGARLHKPFTDDSAGLAIDALARASIQTFPDDLTTTTPLEPVDGAPSPLAFARFQVRNMALEVADRSGISGRQIDGAAPVPPEAPPVSYLLAAYAQTDTTFGSRLSGALLEGQPLEDPPDVIFPTLVIALFVSDLAMAQEKSTASTRADAAVAFARPATLPRIGTRLAAFDPCTAFSQFIDSIINKVIGAITGLLGSNGFFKAIVDIALRTLARNGFAILADVLLSNPIMTTIREALGGVAIAVLVVTSLRAWSVQVSTTPSNVHYSVEGGPPSDGRISATVDDPGGEFLSGPVRSCAELLHVTLPKGGAPGSKATWMITDGIPNHATQVSRDDIVPEARVVSLTYGMNAESADAHSRGDARDGCICVAVAIERQDRNSLKKLIDELVNRAGILSPIAATIAQEVKDKLDALAVPTGFAAVLVSYHSEPEPTARPTATSAGPCLDLARRLPPPDFIEVYHQEGAPGCLIGGRTAMSLDELDPFFSERLSTVGMVIVDKTRLDQNTPGFPKLQFIFGGPGAIEGSSITASTEAYGIGVAIIILTGGG